MISWKYESGISSVRGTVLMGGSGISYSTVARPTGPPRESRPEPTAKPAADPFDGDRSDVCSPHLYLTQRPVRRVRLTAARHEQRRRLARRERHVEAIERQREAHTARLDVSLQPPAFVFSVVS